MADRSRNDYIRKMKYLLLTKEDIKRAIINSGVDVSDSVTFREYANKILEIQTGEGKIPTWVELINELREICEVARDEALHYRDKAEEYSVTTKEAAEIFEIVKEQINLLKDRVDDLTSTIGKPNGLATLDSTGKVNKEQLPETFGNYEIGYYKDGDFYYDSSYTEVIPKDEHKLYLNIPTNRLFSYSKNAGYLRIGNDSKIVCGYYHNGKFYEDADFTNEIQGKVGFIYIDIPTTIIKEFDGFEFVEVLNPSYATKVHTHIVEDITDIDFMSKEDMEKILN